MATNLPLANPKSNRHETGTQQERRWR